MSLATRHTATPAEDAAKVLIRAGLICLMVALPCAGVFSRGAIYILVPVGAILTLLGAAVGEAAHGPGQLRKAFSSRAGSTALFLAFWAGLSLVWTPFLTEAVQRYLQTVGTTLLIAFAAAYLPEKTKPFDLYLLPSGVALASAATLVLGLYGPLWFIGGSEFDETTFERSIITIVVLVWPALGALSLREHWTLAAGLALLAAGAALAGFAQIALAAMGAGALTFAIAMSDPSKTARALARLAAGLILLAPALPLAFGLVMRLVGHGGPQGSAPITATMAVWADNATGQWPRLVTGHGFDAANRGFSLGYLPVRTPKSLLFVVWYDLGLIGAVAFAILTHRVFLLAGRIPPLVAPAVMAGLVAILTLGFLGVATAQIWWVTLIDCAVIAFVILIKGIYRTQRPFIESRGALEDENAGPDSPPGFNSKPAFPPISDL
ncbi:hypothetical protein [Methylocapsa palsarum]|uniref:O-antigen ligase n=1 Tax=Methylocapsa palsarum TaxID=1612308 RepID=A0A1I4BR78_9HYPH|nr:hypothetical protein [Methylocapsa palsarum]SFK71314.1 hypothetical protein SAMN05444581_11634 [Methylocapsa palsarum]